MAAQVLLDMDMPLFHFRRVKHPRVPNRATSPKGGVQEAIVRGAQSRGEELHVARSDLEYLCKPFPTFPHWVALTIGAVLLADSLDLGGVVTGRNISGIYLGWGSEFTPDGEQESRWEALFAAAGLELIHPGDTRSGKVEVGMVLGDTLALAGASDVLSGTVDKPCLQCMKCLITELISAAAQGAPISDELILSLTSNQKVIRSFDRPPPYPSQHLLAYSLARIADIGSTFLAAARDFLEPTREDTEWTNRYYQPALSERLSPEMAARVSTQEKHAEYRTPEDETALRHGQRHQIDCDRLGMFHADQALLERVA
jgi:hypothetical protein